jgi:hypothetical protein
MRCIRMELGEPDASGRRRPVPVPGSEFDLEVDIVIMALGTRPNPLVFFDVQGAGADPLGHGGGRRADRPHHQATGLGGRRHRHRRGDGHQRDGRRQSGPPPTCSVIWNTAASGNPTCGGRPGGSPPSRPRVGATRWVAPRRVAPRRVAPRRVAPSRPRVGATRWVAPRWVAPRRVAPQPPARRGDPVGRPPVGRPPVGCPPVGRPQGEPPARPGASPGSPLQRPPLGRFPFWRGAPPHHPL